MRITSAATSTRTNQNANICCQQVDNNFSPPTMEQKMACPSNTPYTILKDGIVLLEHEACQEQPLDLLGTFKNRNPAMGTPNLCGFYYRMTDFVASQLYHLKLSEDGEPRPNFRKIYSEQICSFWMSSAVRVSWCSICGSKFSWPPHCPQCSDWWEWKLVHVSLRPGSELLPWLAPQQFAPIQWY